MNGREREREKRCASKRENAAALAAAATSSSSTKTTTGAAAAAAALYRQGVKIPAGSQCRCVRVCARTRQDGDNRRDAGGDH